MTYRASSVVAANCVYYAVQNLESDMTNVGWVNIVTGNVQNAGPSNTQAIWDWWQSPGTNNAIGQNWYIGIGRDAASQTNIYFTIAATMINSSASNTVVAGFPPVSSSMPAANSANTLASGQNANTCNNSGNVFTLGYTASLPTTGNGMLFTYSILIDRLIINVANGSTLSNSTCFYVGTYDSFMPLSVDPYPLICANVGGITPSDIGLQYGMSLSEPANTTTVTDNFYVGQVTWNPMCQSADPYLGGGGTNPPRYPVSRIAVGGRSWGGRGLLRDVLITSVLSTAPQRGDTLTFTFNGTVYTYTYLGTSVETLTFLDFGGSSSTGYSPWVNNI